MTAQQAAGSVSSLPAFALERFFSKYEFTAPHIACASDLEAMTMKEILALADEECRELWDNLALKYTETLGLPQLRQEIVKQLYPGLQSDQVNVLCPQEGIFISMNALLAPSDHVIAIAPSYQSLTAVAESIGCQVSLWRCQERDGDDSLPLTFDIAELESLVQANTKLLVVNFPHNPTGFLPSQTEWQGILTFCKKHDLFLFSDEMYHGLESEPSLQLPPACTVYEKAVSLSGMSKTFGMPGVRIGWLASQNAAFLEKVATLKDYTTICPPGPSEILSLIALRNKDTIIQRNLDIIRRGTAAVQKFMDTHKDVFAFQAPMAGSITFPKLIGSSKSTTVAEYAQRLVDESGILILPGDVYGDTAYNNRFRLSVGRADIPEIMELWEKQFITP